MRSIVKGYFLCARGKCGRAIGLGSSRVSFLELLLELSQPSVSEGVPDAEQAKCTTIHVLHSPPMQRQPRLQEPVPAQRAHRVKREVLVRRVVVEVVEVEEAPVHADEDDVVPRRVVVADQRRERVAVRRLVVAGRWAVEDVAGL